MSEVALMAAAEWARTNVARGIDPVEFGNKVAQVYCACTMSEHHAGDEKATVAALAALSVRSEVLQALALLSSLGTDRLKDTCQTHRSGAES